MKANNPSYHICKHLIDKALGAESSDPLVGTWKTELSSLQTTCDTNRALLEVLSLTVAILKATAAEAASEGDVKRRKGLEEAALKASAIAFSLTSNMSEEDYIQRAELEYSPQELDILQQTVSVLLESNSNHKGVIEMASNLEKLSDNIDKREKRFLPASSVRQALGMVKAKPPSMSPFLYQELKGSNIIVIDTDSREATELLYRCFRNLRSTSFRSAPNAQLRWA